MADTISDSPVRHKTLLSPAEMESQCHAAKVEALPTIDKTIFVASTDSSLTPVGGPGQVSFWMAHQLS